MLDGTISQKCIFILLHITSLQRLIYQLRHLSAAPVLSVLDVNM